MTKRIGALLLSILLVLTLLPANAYAAKVTKPTIKTKLTVKVGAKKTAKITAGGWTIKSVKVAKYSKKGIVTAKATKKTITFKGKEYVVEDGDVILFRFNV